MAEKLRSNVTDEMGETEAALRDVYKFADLYCTPNTCQVLRILLKYFFSRVFDTVFQILLKSILFLGKNTFLIF